MKEATLVVLKPDAISKRLEGDILARLGAAGLKLAGVKVIKVSRDLAEKHYSALKDKPFFDQIVRYLMGEFHGTHHTLAFVYEGPDAVRRVREVCGATHPEAAEPGTIRGAYGRIHSSTGLFENLVHASSSKEDAEREIKLWFQPEELLSEVFAAEEIETTQTKKVWSQER